MKKKRERKIKKGKEKSQNVCTIPGKRKNKKKKIRWQKNQKPKQKDAATLINNRRVDG